MTPNQHKRCCEVKAWLAAAQRRQQRTAHSDTARHPSRRKFRTMPWKMASEPFTACLGRWHQSSQIPAGDGSSMMQSRLQRLRKRDPSSTGVVRPPYHTMTQLELHAHSCCNTHQGGRVYPATHLGIRQTGISYMYARYSPQCTTFYNYMAVL